MDLERMDDAAGGAGSAGDGQSPTGRSIGDGHAKFTLSPRRQQLIGLTKEKARRRPLQRWVRAVGHISYDPDLVAAIEEYRQAAAGGANAAQASPEGKRLRLSLIQSIAARLRLLGLSDPQIAELPGRTGPPAELMTGPKGGRVWVFIDVFASELGSVQSGQLVEARTNAVPDRVFPGAVKAVDRAVNPMTRTARARALVQNLEGLLKPEMYLDVRIRVPLGVRLSVPAEAILDSGERQMVFVVADDGAIEPRVVTIDRRGEDHVGIASGIVEGETVATSANFLIDSESRLRSALSAFGRAGEGNPR
jgi:Cu(I)/Ag(I) efflux system membrane fusion protein